MGGRPLRIPVGEDRIQKFRDQHETRVVSCSLMMVLMQKMFVWVSRPTNYLLNGECEQFCFSLDLFPLSNVIERDSSMQPSFVPTKIPRNSEKRIIMTSGRRPSHFVFDHQIRRHSKSEHELYFCRTWASDSCRKSGMGSRTYSISSTIDQINIMPSSKLPKAQRQRQYVRFDPNPDLRHR